MPDKFLNRIAAYYCRNATIDNLSRYVFVVPNRRSGLFLKKYFKEQLAGLAFPVMMPRFVTSARLMADLSASVVMNRSEQLFLLYRCYIEVLDGMGRSEQSRDFDRFAFWADIILNDFNDIDSSLADATAVFKNLKGVKTIAADYLTDEQKEIVRHLWGDSQYTVNNAGRFWLNMDRRTATGIDAGDPADESAGESAGEAVEESEMQRRFIQLWELLGPLYSLFMERVEAMGFTTEGGQQRKAVESLRDHTARISDRHFVFTAFAAVTNAEFEVMRRLNDFGAATFFWDIDTLPDRKFDGNTARSSAFFAILHRLRRLSHMFAMPDDFVRLPASWPESIECIALPSNTAQAKCAGQILNEWFPPIGDSARTPELTDQRAAALLDTAVVIPDDYLLLPVVMSIPPGVEKLNISMRLPYNVTPFAALLDAFISMQLRARVIHGEYHFYYEDVERVLSHPHIHTIAPKASEEIIDWLKNSRQFNIQPREIIEFVPDLAPLFQPVKDLGNIAEIHSYMCNVLDTLSARLHEVCANTGLIEYEMLDYFRQQITEFYHLVEKYHVEMSENTYFTLFERLLSNRRIDLHGSPLCGLQIMGVLETRALDFDRMILLSVNERILPKRTYLRTMIPASLRRGSGLPTADQADGEYTYYFYRMIAGASDVKILYDSRTGNLGSGEPSRFVAQLRNLFGSQNIAFRTVVLDAQIGQSAALAVDKNTPAVKTALERLRTPGDRYLSASALKTYKRCPMAFYLQNIRGVSDENDVVDYLDSASYGTVMHSVFEHLLRPFEGRMVTAADLKAILSNHDNILAAVEHEMLEYTNQDRRKRNKPYRPLTHENRILARVVCHFVERTLQLEIDRMADRPFVYVKGEMKVSEPQWTIAPDLKVNFKIVIDRVDRTDDGRLRFIDYKTGGDTAVCKNIDDLFATSKYDAIFQLLTYSEAYTAMVDGSADIQPVVYPFTEMIKTGRIPDIEVDGQTVLSHRQLSEGFLPKLQELIADIFDMSKPFLPAEDIEACQYCNFKAICGKA